MNFSNLLFVGLVILSGYFIFSFLDDQLELDQRENPVGLLMSEVDVMAEDIEIEQGADGTLLWRVKAPKGRFLYSEGKIFLDKPVLNYFKDRPLNPLRVTALSGEIWKESRIAFLKEEVFLTMDNSTLSSDMLKYDPEKSFLEVQGDVRYVGSEVKLMSSHALINPETRNIQANGEVEVNIWFN